MQLNYFLNNDIPDFSALAESMPSILDYETEKNKKNGYQDIQQVFFRYGAAAAELDAIREQNTISLYLSTLSACIPLIDEEVFDHRMNLVTQYRSLLRRILPFLSEYSEENRSLISISIASAIQSGTLLREKYQKYTEGI